MNYYQDYVIYVYMYIHIYILYIYIYIYITPCHIYIYIYTCYPLLHGLRWRLEGPGGRHAPQHLTGGSKAPLNK